MDKRNRLHQQYCKLTVYERIRLLLAAQERGDLSELEALDESCPDADFRQYLVGILGLQYSACLLVIQLLAFGVLAFSKLMDLAQEQEAGATPAPHDKLLPLLAQSAPIWRGFVTVCQDIGYDPHQVLGLAPLGKDANTPAFFVIHQLIEHLDLLTQVEGGALLNSDHVRTWRKLFYRAFPF
jgi:hypothetical protein